MEEVCCDLKVDVNGEETFMVDKVRILTTLLQSCQLYVKISPI